MQGEKSTLAYDRIFKRWIQNRSKPSINILSGYLNHWLFMTWIGRLDEIDIYATTRPQLRRDVACRDSDRTIHPGGC